MKIFIPWFQRRESSSPTHNPIKYLAFNDISLPLVVFSCLLSNVQPRRKNTMGSSWPHLPDCVLSTHTSFGSKIKGHARGCSITLEMSSPADPASRHRVVSSATGVYTRVRLSETASTRVREAEERRRERWWRLSNITTAMGNGTGLVGRWSRYRELRFSRESWPRSSLHLLVHASPSSYRSKDTGWSSLKGEFLFLRFFFFFLIVRPPPETLRPVQFSASRVMIRNAAAVPEKDFSIFIRVVERIEKINTRRFFSRLGTRAIVIYRRLIIACCLMRVPIKTRLMCEFRSTLAGTARGKAPDTFEQYCRFKFLPSVYIILYAPDTSEKDMKIYVNKRVVVTLTEREEARRRSHVTPRKNVLIRKYINIRVSVRRRENKWKACPAVSSLLSRI